MMSNKSFSLNLHTGMTPMQIESFLHTICDTHGWNNCNVVMQGNELVLVYQDHIAPATNVPDSVPRIKC